VEPALLSLPHPWTGIRLLQAALALAGLGSGIYLASTPPENPEALTARLLAALLFLSLAVLLGMAALSGVRFTERGASGPSGSIGWVDVAAYHWDGPALTLVPRRPLPFFAPMPWPIPAGQREAVEAVLSRCVGPGDTE
jgi:hypothetical protein